MDSSTTRTRLVAAATTVTWSTPEVTRPLFEGGTNQLKRREPGYRILGSILSVRTRLATRRNCLENSRGSFDSASSVAGSGRSGPFRPLWTASVTPISGPVPNFQTVSEGVFSEAHRTRGLDFQAFSDLRTQVWRQSAASCPRCQR